MPASKRALMLSRIETWHDLYSAGHLPPEKIKEAAEKAVASGELKVLPESAFEEKTSELLNFAKEFGLVKEKGTGGGRGPSESSYATLIKSQYPDTAPLFEAVENLRSQTFSVTEDGEVKQVRFMPFFRDITPKPERGEEKLPAEENV